MTITSTSEVGRPMAPAPSLRLAIGAMAAGAWSMLSANSVDGAVYYDLWALRSAALGVDYDCWHDRRVMRQRGDCNAHEIRINSSAPIMEVNSAFNGLAIYSVAGLRSAPGCVYDGGHTCEHVGFHLCLRRHGLQIGIAPFLLQGCGDGAPREEIGPARMHVYVPASGRAEARIDPSVPLQPTVASNTSGNGRDPDFCCCARLAKYGRAVRCSEWRRAPGAEWGGKRRRESE